MNINDFLFHKEVQRLSLEIIMIRTAEFTNDIAILLGEHENDFAEKFEDQYFILSLSYLADIFSYLNDLNLSRQCMVVNDIFVQRRWKPSKRSYHFGNIEIRKGM